MKRTRMIIFLLLFIYILSTFSFTDTESIDSENVIKVGADNNYPPYEFVIDGEPAGFNIDLIKAVAEVMNMNIEIHSGVWSDIRNDLVHGETDILSGMLYSEERDKEVDFSTSHVFLSHSLFARTDSSLSNFSNLLT